jgi:hypothetical protein
MAGVDTRIHLMCYRFLSIEPTGNFSFKSSKKRIDSLPRVLSASAVIMRFKKKLSM